MAGEGLQARPEEQRADGVEPDDGSDRESEDDDFDLVQTASFVYLYDVKTIKRIVLQGHSRGDDPVRATA